MEMFCTNSVDDLAALIAECHFTAEEQSNALLLVESLPQHVIGSAEQRQDLLWFTAFNADIPLANYSSGRIFHHDFELRWEKNDSKTQVVYIGIERSIPSLKTERSLKLKKCQEPKYYYLFGKRLEPEELRKIGITSAHGYYAEVRIPRLLHYHPAPEGARRVWLAVCEYVDEATGKVELFRFQGLEAAE